MLGLSFSSGLAVPPPGRLGGRRGEFWAPVSPSVWGLGLGGTYFGGPFWVNVFKARLCRLPRGDVVDGLQIFGFPPPWFPN